MYQERIADLNAGMAQYNTQIDRPASSVQIRKEFSSDGTTTDWEAIDLTEPE